jgi:hypothetical protein
MTDKERDRIQEWSAKAATRFAESIDTVRPQLGCPCASHDLSHDKTLESITRLAKKAIKEATMNIRRGATMLIDRQANYASSCTFQWSEEPVVTVRLANTSCGESQTQAAAQALQAQQAHGSEQH